MTDIQQIVRLLQSDQPSIRRNACEQLMVLPVLTQDAIDALKIATHDADSSVAKAAQRAIELHQFDIDLSQDAIDTLNVPVDTLNVPVDTPQQAETKATVAQLEEKIRLERMIKGGASTFYWIAALSIINSFFVLTGGNWSFIIGLGITQFIDGIFIGIVQEIGENAALAIRIIGFVIDLFFAGIFIVFGVFARKQQKWAFVAGIVLYTLDSLLFLAIRDFIGFGFHILLLAGIISGLISINKYNELIPKISA